MVPSKHWRSLREESRYWLCTLPGWTYIHTRVDIAHAVGMLSRFLTRSSAQHITANHATECSTTSTSLYIATNMQSTTFDNGSGLQHFFSSDWFGDPSSRRSTDIRIHLHLPTETVCLPSRSVSTTIITYDRYIEGDIVGINRWMSISVWYVFMYVYLYGPSQLAGVGIVEP